MLIRGLINNGKFLWKCLKKQAPKPLEKHLSFQNALLLLNSF